MSLQDNDGGGGLTNWWCWAESGGRRVQRSGGRGLKRRESINIWEMTERVLSSQWFCLFLGRAGEPTGKEGGSEGGKLWWNTFRGGDMFHSVAQRQDSPSRGHPAARVESMLLIWTKVIRLLWEPATLTSAVPLSCLVQFAYDTTTPLVIGKKVEHFAKFVYWVTNVAFI